MVYKFEIYHFSNTGEEGKKKLCTKKDAELNPMSLQQKSELHYLLLLAH